MHAALAFHVRFDRADIARREAESERAHMDTWHGGAHTLSTIHFPRKIEPACAGAGTCVHLRLGRTIQSFTAKISGGHDGADNKHGNHRCQ